MIVATCSAPPASQGLLGGLLGYLDCQTQAIGAGGFQALSAPGSSVSLALTGMLALLVALLGYRMLLGQTLGVRDGVLTMLKIGVVLAFTVSWPAYRTLVYDVALKAPAEMAAEIGAPAGLPGTGGGLVGRLDGLDRAFIVLATIERTQPAVPAAPRAEAMPPTPFDAYALGSARIVYLTAAAAALAAVRLVAGLLLALGPLFIAFLLFEGTRGLFEGWVRVLVGAALGALGVAITLGVELALLEPRLAELIARRAAGEVVPGAGIELFVIALVFALALVAMLVATARLALGLRLPWWNVQAPSDASASNAAERRFLRRTGEPKDAADRNRPRAAAVADAVAATQRREASGAESTAGPGGAPTRRIAAHAPSHDVPMAPPPTPLGQSFRRRVQARASAASGRRDAI